MGRRRDAEADVPTVTQLVHVGDREADIFERFAQPRASQSDLLIRAEQNRRVQHELGTLKPTLQSAPVLSQVRLELQRNPKRPARTAQLSIKAMAITLKVPSNRPKSQGLVPVNVNAILVDEPDPPTGTQPIRWLLLTSLPIDTFEQVWQCVVWYSYRWLIERFHFTLKSGCRIAALQLQHKDRLVAALATYSIIAWRLMHLTYSARLQPQVSCETVLEPKEWRVLRRKFEPKNRSKPPLTLQQAVRWIAQLGGFRARKRDGEPGVKCLWQGLSRFHHLLAGVQLARQSQSL